MTSSPRAEDGIEETAFGFPIRPYIAGEMARTVIEIQDSGLEEALSRARRGDHDAFSELVGRFEAMVFSIALHALRDRSTAEEVAQDIFLRLFRSLSDIESLPHLTFWLRRATSNRCIDELRRPRLMAREVDPELDATVGHPETDHFLHARLKTLVRELPDAQRLAVILRYQEELEPSEISEILDIPLNTIKSHLRRALAAIRSRLTPARGSAAGPLAALPLQTREIKL